MLIGIGAVYSYYSDAPPDQATLNQIAAGGSTVQFVDRAESQGVAYSQETGEAVPVTGSPAESDPYIRGGGNPLYANPMNIPQPPRPYTESCFPTDTSCVLRNQAKDAAWGDLAELYNKALNGAFDPTAPDRYIAALTAYKASAGAPLPTTTPQAQTQAPVTKATAPVTDQSKAAQRPPIVFQPKVTNGAPAGPVPVIDGATGSVTAFLTSTPVGGGIPGWALIGGAAVAAFLFLGRKR